MQFQPKVLIVDGETLKINKTGEGGDNKVQGWEETPEIDKQGRGVNLPRKSKSNGAVASMMQYLLVTDLIFGLAVNFGNKNSSTLFTVPVPSL